MEDPSRMIRLSEVVSLDSLMPAYAPLEMPVDCTCAPHATLAKLKVKKFASVTSHSFVQDSSPESASVLQK